LLNEKERRANIHREKAVEILHRRVFDVRRLPHACIRHENVQPLANDRANLPGQIVCAVRSGKIRSYPLSPAPGIANLGDDGFGFGLAASIVNQNLRAGLGKC
jgi:hypothetical protein